MKSEKYSILKKENLLSFFGGLIFVIIFIWGYSFIDNNWYEYRDDGVITMSVARNLVDAGFIGVGVSGPIVEASSSPMQIFVYALAYLLTGIDYIDFSYWQTTISTFLIGFIFLTVIIFTFLTIIFCPFQGFFELIVIINILIDTPE